MKAQACIGVFNAVRKLFHCLRAAGDALHSVEGVSTAMRGVMEDLSRAPATVSAMARRRPVSRQHIQALADALMAKGLARPRENPSHRRSPLIELTPKGAAVFARMRRREAAFIGALPVKATEAQLRAAESALRKLISALEGADGLRS